jgi:tRNA pseudouridine55 synthase
MYKAAREGQEILREPRPVTVYDFKVWRDDSNVQLMHYCIKCSKGTYVRALVHELVRPLLEHFMQQPLRAIHTACALQDTHTLSHLFLCQERSCAPHAQPSNRKLDWLCIHWLD